MEIIKRLFERKRIESKIDIKNTIDITTVASNIIESAILDLHEPIISLRKHSRVYSAIYVGETRGSCQQAFAQLTTILTESKMFNLVSIKKNTAQEVEALADINDLPWKIICGSNQESDPEITAFVIDPIEIQK